MMVHFDNEVYIHSSGLTMLTIIISCVQCHGYSKHMQTGSIYLSHQIPLLLLLVVVRPHSLMVAL